MGKPTERSVRAPAEVSRRRFLASSTGAVVLTACGDGASSPTDGSSESTTGDGPSSGPDTGIDATTSAGSESGADGMTSTGPGADTGDSSSGGNCGEVDVDGALVVVDYQANLGVGATPGGPMFWQSSYTTVDGTLIELGTGDHGPTSDNSVREFDPIAGVQTEVYPNNNGTSGWTQYDNLTYWYLAAIDSVVVPARGQYSRADGAWVRSEESGLPPADRPRVFGTDVDALIRPLDPVDVALLQSTYNGHHAASATHDCAVTIAGGSGGDLAARLRLWLVAPSAGHGAFAEPYVLIERELPAMVAGAAPHKISGRDGCCFLGDHVYWVGGADSGTSEPGTAHFFRMSIVPHLTDATAPLEIERLCDAPAGFTFGLLRADPMLEALLCITDVGIFAYDPHDDTWSTVTPPAYAAEFPAESPTLGLMPRGCLGDFVVDCGDPTLRRFIWRPGHNHAWEFADRIHEDAMHRNFRAIQLARR